MNSVGGFRGCIADYLDTHTAVGLHGPLPAGLVDCFKLLQQYRYQAFSKSELENKLPTFHIVVQIIHRGTSRWPATVYAV